MISVYLASSSHETSRVNAIADKLIAHGLRVVSTWHREPDRALKAGFDDLLSVTEQREIAERCIDEMFGADLMWLVWPRTASIGAYAELGVAIALARFHYSMHVVVSGVGCSRSVYTSLADFRDTSDEAALHEVLTFARRRQLAEAR